MSLLDIDPLLDMIKLVLQSAYVKNKLYPVSLLLIAKPESGKSASMKMFSKVKGTYTTDVITQSVIASKIFPMIENKNLKHLIIPDVLNVTDKAMVTKKGTMNMMKSLMEEGVTSLDSFNVRTNKVYDPPLQLGIITGITSESYYGTYVPEKGRTVGGLRHYLKVTGILSRFLPFSYKYMGDKLSKIFDFINEEEYLKNPPKQKIKRVPKVIEGNAELFRKLNYTSAMLGHESGGYGIRIQRDLQTLAKANAMLNDRDKVTEEDIDKILKLSKWINYDFNPL